MKNIRNIRGVNLPVKRMSLSDARIAGFRAGQSPAWTRAGFISITVAVFGWFVLQHTPLIWPWTIGWLLVLVLWAATYWTVGDNDDPQSHRAQSTPGFDQGPIDQQAQDVIHRTIITRRHGGLQVDPPWASPNPLTDNL